MHHRLQEAMIVMLKMLYLKVFLGVDFIIDPDSVPCFTTVVARLFKFQGSYQLNIAQSLNLGTNEAVASNHPNQMGFKKPACHHSAYAVSSICKSAQHTAIYDITLAVPLCDMALGHGEPNCQNCADGQAVQMDSN